MRITGAYFAILSVLILVFSVPATAHTIDISRPDSEGVSASSSSQTNLRLLDRTAGIPSDADFYEDFIVLGNYDAIELRTESYALQSIIRLPQPISEIAVNQNGSIIAAHVTRGISYLRITTNNHLRFIDNIGTGKWEKVEIGEDFFAAHEISQDYIQVFDLTDDEIIAGPVMTGHKLAVDSNSIITYNRSHITFWNRSISKVPPEVMFFPSYPGPWNLDFKGPLLVWSGMNSWFDLELNFGSILNLHSKHEIDHLATFYGLSLRTICWNEQYLYVDTSCFNTPPGNLGFVAFDVSDTSNISIAYDFNDTEYSEVYKWRKVVDGEHAFIGFGFNVVTWWDASNPMPTLLSRKLYPGYICDLAIAHSNSDSIGQQSLTQGPPTPIQGGYPTVRSRQPMVVGDIFDIHSIGGHFVYENRDEILPLLTNRNRAEYERTGQPMWGDWKVFNDSLYRLEYEWDESQEPSKRLVLNRCQADWEKDNITSSVLLDIPSEYTISLNVGDIHAGEYYGVSLDRILAVDLSTLHYSINDAPFSTDLIDVEVVGPSRFGAKLIAMYSDWLVSYDIAVGRGNTKYLEPISSRSVNGRVITSMESTIFIANSTHVMSVPVLENGEFGLMTSVIAPTSFSSTNDVGFHNYEPTGDLIVDSASGLLCRAAGEYGIWAFNLTEYSEADSGDDQPQQVLPIALPAASIGIAVGFTLGAIVLILFEREEVAEYSPS